MIGQPGALWIPSPFYSRFTWPYDGGKPKWIIIHGTASGISYPAQSTGKDFQRQGNSTHYVIGYDGTIVQCVDESYPAWGNGVISGPAGVAPLGGGNPKAPHDAFWDTAGHRDPNGCTISIEHSKSQDNSSALSVAQEQASFNLVAGICQRWGIPAQLANANGGITGHYSMDPINRSFCPGTYPWQSLISYASGSSKSGIYMGVSYDPSTGLYTSGVGFGTGISVSQGQSQQPPQPIMDAVHQTLVSNAGFYGIALAVDEAEQFPGYIDLTSPITVSTPLGDFSIPDLVGIARSWGATISDNFLPFAIRSGLVLFGFILLLLLIAKAAMPVIEKAAPLLLAA